MVHLSGVVAVAAFCLGWRRSAIAVTCWAVLAHSIVFSYGKIDHTYLPWLFPAFLSLSGWGRRSESKRAFAPTLAPAAALLAVAWLTAALPKARGGWLSLETQAVASFLETSSKTGPARSLVLQLPIVVHEVLDWTVVIFEFAMVAAVVSMPRIRAASVAVAALFHLSALAVFGIGGDGLAASYVLLLVPFQRDLGLESHRGRLFAIVLLASCWRAASSVDRFQLWLFDWVSQPERPAAVLIYGILGLAATLTVLRIQAEPAR